MRYIYPDLNLQPVWKSLTVKRVAIPALTTKMKAKKPRLFPHSSISQDPLAASSTSKGHMDFSRSVPKTSMTLANWCSFFWDWRILCSPRRPSRKSFLRWKSRRIAFNWSRTAKIPHTWKSWWEWPMMSKIPGRRRSGKWVAYQKAAKPVKMNCRAWK